MYMLAAICFAVCAFKMPCTRKRGNARRGVGEYEGPDLGPEIRRIDENSITAARDFRCRDEFHLRKDTDSKRL
ncbi:hypothetical protein B0H19DRAFT_1097317 [Mycena capillaripes]|nr:hypothetical protein B0H19DRAFT_1097317 [Mycena capillaripes]